LELILVKARNRGGIAYAQWGGWLFDYLEDGWMSYASMLVHVDSEGPLDGRCSIAADLADRFHASLIGIAAWAPMSVFPPAEEVIQNPAIGDLHLRDMRALLDQRGKEFHATFGGPDRRLEWRSVLDFPTEAVAREARAADLVIIGNVKENRGPFRDLHSGSTILKAGRPVLVVPKRLDSLLPRRIAIAWKDVREARRAVGDALPFLQAAQSVVIVEILEEGDQNGAVHRLQDVANYLARHRVATVTQRVRPADVTAVDALMRFVEDENVDLLVSGAYGHSRLGEWVFGGVTRELLAAAPICCLFSH
jgi:nucleotide-binding universal stress UspA family protein